MIKIEQIKCPKCGSEDLIYNEQVLEGNSCYYPFTCDNCGCFGKEYYNMTYDCTICDN